jgi:hypothetical protein
MAKKTVSRSKAEPKPAVAGDAAPAAKPRARAKARTAAEPLPNDTVVSDETEQTNVSGASRDTDSVSMASEPSEDDIRLRAYHRYLERGGGHGMDFEDWLEARRDLIEKK